jgi:mannitol-specific phosphotransferase system IIBC component
MLFLTPNQAAIVASLSAAAISAIVSFFTAHYIVKHGADYGKQINNIHETLAALARTQDELRQQQALMFEAEKQRRSEEEQRAESARWKPKAWITSKAEGNEQVNKLCIQSAQSFSVIEVSLFSTTGAKLCEYPVLGWKLSSTGFSIPITHQSLLQIANTSQSFFQSGSFEGMIRYSVQRDGRDVGSFTGEIRFRADSVSVASTQWFKLSG